MGYAHTDGDMLDILFLAQELQDYVDIIKLRICRVFFRKHIKHAIIKGFCN